jgi:hypothetical protein
MMSQLLFDDRGQNTFEYMLLVSGFVIVIVSILAAGFFLLIPQVLGQLCPSVDTVDPATPGSCIGP